MSGPKTAPKTKPKAPCKATNGCAGTKPGWYSGQYLISQRKTYGPSPTSGGRVNPPAKKRVWARHTKRACARRAQWGPGAKPLVLLNNIKNKVQGSALDPPGAARPDPLSSLNHSSMQKPQRRQRPPGFGQLGPFNHRHAVMRHRLPRAH